MDSGDSRADEHSKPVIDTDSESPDPTLSLPTDASSEAKPMETEDKNKGDPALNQDIQSASLPTETEFSLIPPGTTAEAEIDYKLRDRKAGKGAGVIVIVRNETFEYEHKDVNWRSEECWDYDRDIELLENTFGSAAADDITILKRDDDLTSKNFDKFISEDVLKESHETTKTQGNLTETIKELPSFLMFFLMSTGFEDGTFLMTNRRQSGSCCTKFDVHTQNEECHERSVIKHVIQRVQGSKGFSGVPKVFIIQMLKRVRADPEPPSKGPKDKVPKKITEADFYIPKGSDTFVLYSCMEMHKDWKSKNDPFIIRAFCNKVQELGVKRSVTALLNISQILGLPSQDQHGAAKSSSLIIQELNEHLKVTKGYTSLSLTPESLTNGWLTSVCQQTTATVVNFIAEEEKKDPHAKNKLRSLYEDKQRPIMSSTLRRGFSMVKLMNMMTNND